MKPLHRIAIALGVAEVAVVAAAARRHGVHTATRRTHGCDPAGHGTRSTHGTHHGRHHRPGHPGAGDRPASGDDA